MFVKFLFVGWNAIRFEIPKGFSITGLKRNMYSCQIIIIEIFITSLYVFDWSLINTFMQYNKTINSYDLYFPILTTIKS